MKVFAVALLAAVVAAPGAVSAASVEELVVEVVPDPGDGGDPILGLQLTYRDKDDRGFKFVGTGPLSKVAVTTPAGDRLRWQVFEGGEQKRIDFDVPPPVERGGPQTVRLAFRQPLDATRYGWGYRSVDLYWAHQFKIPVGRMAAHVHTAPGALAPGYDCGAPTADGQQLCSREASSAFEVYVPEVPRREARDYAILGAVTSIGLLLGGLLVWRQYRRLAVEEGILAAAVDAADDFVPPEPLPMGGEGEATLAPPQRAAFLERLAISSALALATVLGLAVVLDGRSPVPMPLLTGAAFVVMTAAVVFWKGRPISVDIPNHVELKVSHCEPGVRGDTATNVTKPATLETGLEVNVPLFINVGDTLKVDTTTGQYIERTARG